jgi:inner membrane protein
MRPPLTRRRLALAVGALALADWGAHRAGSSTVPGGPLDETAHLLTTLLWLWALGPRVMGQFGAPALVASVAIDADHIPDRLGLDLLTAGTPRPYTHSLLTVAVVLAAALLWRRRRKVLLGVAFGLLVHFWRDLSEPGSGVSLLWPVAYRSFSLAHAGYLAGIAAVTLVAAWRAGSQPATATEKTGGKRSATLIQLRPASAEPNTSPEVAPKYSCSDSPSPAEAKAWRRTVR